MQADVMNIYNQEMSGEFFMDDTELSGVNTGRQQSTDRSPAYLRITRYFG